MSGPRGKLNRWLTGVIAVCAAYSGVRGAEQARGLLSLRARLQRLVCGLALHTLDTLADGFGAINKAE